MAQLTFREKFLIADVESTYGADATPGATNAIQTRNLTYTPYDGERVTAEVDRSIIGGYEEINAGPRSAMSFEVYITGHGNSSTPETIPGYAPILRGCGLAQTQNTGTSIVYQPESPAGMDSLSMYFTRTGQVQKQLGCRGNLTMDFTAGQLPFFGLSYMGLYTRPAAQTTPTGLNFGALGTKRPVNNSTTNITIAGHQVKLRSLSLDMQSNLVHENLPNCDDVQITNRNVTGSISFTAEDIATFDFFSKVESHTGAQTFVLQVIHSDDGTTGTGGESVQLDAAQVQFGGIEESEANDKAVYTIPLMFLPSTAGNDEFILTYK